MSLATKPRAPACARPARRRRRRRLWIAAAAAVLLAVGGSAAVSIAWVTSPSTADLLDRATSASRTHGGTPVPLASIAPVLQRAVVATEDERFYRHHGVDVVGVGRALLYDVSHGSAAEGASTITEQLVKNLYLGGNDHSAWRKLEAAVMAFRAENHLS